MSSKKCLLVLDVQLGMFNLSKSLYNGDSLLLNIKKLINKARSGKSKVIYLQYCGSNDSPFKKGSEGWAIHPSITPKAGEYIVKKNIQIHFRGQHFRKYCLNWKLNKLLFAD